MFRNFSLVCAVAAALLFPMTAFAGHGHGGHGHGHGGHGHGGHGHGGHGHGKYHGYHGHYHGGRWYRGRYWGYGVGSCWRWTPGGYIWICGY
jgi:hypothetical protein